MSQDPYIPDENELQLLKDEALPFFHEHLEEFRNYVVLKLEDDAKASLWKITIDFVSHLNLPFNMQRYMSVQTQKIRKCLIENEVQNKLDYQSVKVEKQKIVADWIRREAQSHREDQIKAQKCCLNQFKKQFQKALCKELFTCDIPHPLLNIIMNQDNNIN